MELNCLDHSIFFVEDFTLLRNIISDLSPSNVIVLVDENTEEHCLPLLDIEGLKIIRISSGEENKVLETCAYIWDKLTDFEVDRKGLLINLGGGVVTDMGAFVASTYKRGIRFINIPTTLLAMVDASIGGKTGIDFKGFKNHVGLFSNPEALFINPVFLKTLSIRQYHSGIAEMLKHAMIRDLNHWIDLTSCFTKEKIRSSITLDFIYKSVSIKKKVVAEDPKEENGIRKFLNFGHTLGHAIESYFLQPHIPKNQNLLHGEAIGIGMILEGYLSRAILGFDSLRLIELCEIVRKLYELPRINDRMIPDIIRFLNQDKKNIQGSVNFVLLKNISEPVVDVNASESQIKDAISYYNDVCVIS